MLKKLFYPQIFAVPPVGAVIPVSMLKRVVFPAPLCPKMAVISLGYIFKLMPLTALTGSWPKALNVFSRLEMTSASVSRNWTGISSISGPSKRCWLSSLLLLCVALSCSCWDSCSAGIWLAAAVPVHGPVPGPARHCQAQSWRCLGPPRSNPGA